MEMKTNTTVLIFASIIATGLLATNLSISAFAQKLPESGFGQAAKNFAATSPGAVGEHSSSFAGEPHQGIGNVAKSSDLTVGELGCFLGGIQGVLTCP